MKERLNALLTQLEEEGDYMKVRWAQIPDCYVDYLKRFYHATKDHDLPGNTFHIFWEGMMGSMTIVPKDIKDMNYIILWVEPKPNDNDNFAYDAVSARLEQCLRDSYCISVNTGLKSLYDENVGGSSDNEALLEVGEIIVFG